MRILPVSNYNYQSKTQNNQKQNVNFGMIQGEHIPDELCNLAEFKKFGAVFTGFLTTLMEKGSAVLGGFNVSRKLGEADLAILRKHIGIAEATKVVMSPAEEMRLGKILTDTNLSDADLVKIIGAEISGAELATFPMATKLSDLRKALVAAANASKDGEQHLSIADSIKLNLYQISAKKTPSKTARSN